MTTPIRRLCHWGPLFVLCIIKLVTWAMVNALTMWWPPQGSLSGAINAGIFFMLAASTLYHFLQCIIEGPGYVPLGWQPENEDDKQYLQFCSLCQGYKAPRSHHCKRCKRCIKKLDHHCPWINSCVGHNNHCYFTLFTGSAVIACLQSAVMLSWCVYTAISRARYLPRAAYFTPPVVHFTLLTLLLTLLAIGMAVGVVVAVSVLLYFQLRGMYRNQTTIEEWILEKADSRREENGLPPFVFPYDLGWKLNYMQALFPKHDGLKWPVRDGCGEFDLTREQQAQKEDKRVRSRVYTCVWPYSGRWVPVCAYPRAAITSPCTDDARLPLSPGDLIRTTRQRKHWLFGEKLTGMEGTRGPRGWYPRAAAVPTDELHAKPD